MISNNVIKDDKIPHTQTTSNQILPDMLRQFLVIVAFVGTVIVNAAATILPINNITTGDLSDKYEIFITPAGYVFSIWSVIYAGLLAYTVYQALPSQRTNPILRAIGGPFIFSSIVNMAWIIVWHYEYVPLSLAVMLLILGSLILIYLRLRPAYAIASSAERWTTHIPFSIYLGWITVATIVNVTVLLDYYGWSGAGIAPEVWTAIMLGVATIIGLIMTQVRRDIAYGLVFVWAFAGIAIKHSGVPVVFAAAAVTAAVMASSVVVAYRRSGSTT